MTQAAGEVARSFLGASRRHLIGEYGPKLKRCLQSLSDEELWWRPNAGSNSVGNLVLHLCGNARQWIVSGVGGGPDSRDRDAEFDRTEGSTRDQMLDHLEAAMAEVSDSLAAIEATVSERPDLLLERRTIQGMDVSVLDAIYHVVEHFSQHTGQVMYITKARTGRDLGFWKVEDGVARPNW